jgi:Predicted transcriptional regulators
MSNNNIIGERIKELREQAKEKQWELGEMIFSSQTAISHYENGRIKPNVDTIAAIAKHYNVSADYLLGLTDKKAKTPCDLCRYAPPSSSDGKPCCMCPVED